MFKRIYFYITSIGLVLFTTNPAQQLSAQNIVTIFGQEKIEKTDEGQVFHHFTSGLLLPGGTNPGVLFNGQDMVGWLYATGNFKTPENGEKINLSYPNMQKQFEDAYLTWLAKSNGEDDMQQMPQWTWTSMKVDSAGLFKRPEMRSAFLYTSYNSPNEEIVLLETSGGTRTYINGLPHEGDHYDFGYTLTPIKLKKGLNEFIYTPGRFGKITSKLVKTDKPIQFTKRDMTLPDIIIGEQDAKWAAIRVINATEKPIKGLQIRTTLPNGEQETFTTDEVMPMNVRKLKYKIPAISKLDNENKIVAKVELLDKLGKVIDKTEVELRQVPASITHERTYVSRIDGSVQYYSVTPAVREDKDDKKALVLTVHGAGVEARNQARAYKSKDWTDIIAATNRRPYGFNWEEWGRIDALEVLEEAKRIFKPEESKIYLTGHSMGGHGTWYLGTTYPDKFAAIAPSAGYPDITTYSRGEGDNMHKENPKYDAFRRGANGGRVESLVHNLKQSGVYIFHGDSDNVVSPDQARHMREILGTFHPDFCYYEYPGGEHWFGDESVDWKPIFDFFSRHNLPQKKDVKAIDFYTAAPNISSQDYWLTIEQQVLPYEISNAKANIINDTIKVVKIQNIALFVLDIPSLQLDYEEVVIDIENQILRVPSTKKAIFALENGKWSNKNEINKNQKYSARYGGFKNAFDNNVLLVYGTKGTSNENEWNQNRARFDAETFYYRGNGSVDVISDSEYQSAKYKDRNVVLYGNKDNNAAWSLLLKDSPIQVSRDKIVFDNKTYTGDDLGIYFIYPNPNSEIASIGVVGGTGEKGWKAASPNNYISGITGFPDFMIFRADVLKDGLNGIETAGFFDNNWKMTNHDYK